MPRIRHCVDTRALVSRATRSAALRAVGVFNLFHARASIGG